MVRVVVGGEPRLWLPAGVIAGLGLEAKYTMGFLIIAVVVALTLTRERGRRPGVWPWIGLAVALGLLLPNAIWQAHHGWPSLHFFSSQNARTASDTSRAAYVVQQLLFLGSTALIGMAGVVGCGAGACARWHLSHRS